MQKINIDKTYSYLLFLFCFILPLSDMAKAVPNIILIALGVLLPFHNLRKSVKIIKKELIAILLFISIIIINTALFSRWEDSGEIIRFMYTPLILLLFFSIEDLKPYMKSFLLGTFLVLFLSSIRIVLMYINEGNFDIAVGEEVNKILLGERPYLGFLYFIASCFSFYLYISASKKSHRIAYFILGIVFSLFIFFIVARIMSLAVVISIFLALFYFGKKINFHIKWIGLLLLFFLGLLYSFSDNVVNRFYIGDQNVNVINADPRYHIWDCVYRIFPDNSKEFIFGKGYKKTHDELYECYQEKDDFFTEIQREWFLKTPFNTHNQFFDLLLSQGIIVLVLCLFFFVYMTLKNRKNFFVISLLLATFLFFSVENVLKRQIGCILVAFVLCFVFKQKKSISEGSQVDNLVT